MIKNSKENAYLGFSHAERNQPYDCADSPRSIGGHRLESTVSRAYSIKRGQRMLAIMAPLSRTALLHGPRCLA